MRNSVEILTAGDHKADGGHHHAGPRQRVNVSWALMTSLFPLKPRYHLEWERKQSLSYLSGITGLKRYDPLPSNSVRSSLILNCVPASTFTFYTPGGAARPLKTSAVTADRRLPGPSSRRRRRDGAGKRTPGFICCLGARKRTRPRRLGSRRGGEDAQALLGFLRCYAKVGR